MKKSFTIAVFASGGGGNFQALIDGQDKYGYSIKVLITDRQCDAINRAVTNDIPYFLIDRAKFQGNFFLEVDNKLSQDIDLIVLAGFMPILSKGFCDKWENKIINTHPSLLPKYGGKGMYGVKIQEAVMKAKEKYAGCTVHYVNAEIDDGEIILQKAIEVDYSETPWELGGRVFKEENKLLIEAITLIMARR
ncbi:phosphoribosylglycinamide formyltransferase [Paenibacillus tyrfis]|uniref:phosphoribosylglycinamide formyltransferase n=1 Tax=Paenibacillus tyrfis TaxID=1501230 RepID=UPI001C6FCBC8|nr:phosphoribosylglycinamide formyltransferase [Paenibacillus tyrfis]